MLVGDSNSKFVVPFKEFKHQQHDFLQVFNFFNMLCLLEKIKLSRSLVTTWTNFYRGKKLPGKTIRSSPLVGTKKKSYKFFLEFKEIQ